MTERHSTPSIKPAKPHPAFPLFAHASGRWAKKIRQRLHYFGPWRDPDGALAKYKAQADALHAGRTPREPVEGLTVRQLLNRFMTAKKLQLDTQEIVALTWKDYYQTCQAISAVFDLDRLVVDLDAADFEVLKRHLAKGCGLVSLGNDINRVRIIFKYAIDANLIERPARFGPTFKRPGKRVLRRARQDRAARMFTPKQIHAMLTTAGHPLKAMILLGVNAGYGNMDCARLTFDALDLKGGWTTFPRPKTAVRRRAKLWPETVSAIKDAIAKRPEPKEDQVAKLVFLTAYGRKWSRDTSDTPIARVFAKLAREIGIEAGAGLGFYGLRHTFETVAGETKDQVAVDFVMGHSPGTMADEYREEDPSDARLEAIAMHVHRWLFGARARRL